MAISADRTFSSLVMKSGQLRDVALQLHRTKPNSLLSVFKEAFRLAILAPLNQVFTSTHWLPQCTHYWSWKATASCHLEGVQGWVQEELTTTRSWNDTTAGNNHGEFEGALSLRHLCFLLQKIGGARERLKLQVCIYKQPDQDVARGKPF